jgi:hypothetical protein
MTTSKRYLEQTKQLNKICFVFSGFFRQTENRAAANSTLAIGGVSSPLDSFVVAESSVLRTNFCAEKPAHRQSANRYNQYNFDI